MSTQLTSTWLRDLIRAFAQGAGAMLDESAYWKDVPLLAIDTETTGFKAPDRIVEVSLVLFVGSEVVEHFTSYVNPGFHIPEEASAIHGITDDVVAGAPKFAEIEERVLDLMGRDVPWVLHNAAFDTKMLSKEIAKDRWPRGIPVLCTAETAKRLGHWGQGRGKLQTLKSTFDLPDPGGDAHGAFPDAWLTGHLARKIATGRVFENFTGYSEQYYWSPEEMKDRY